MECFCWLEYFSFFFFYRFLSFLSWWRYSKERDLIRKWLNFHLERNYYLTESRGERESVRERFHFLTKFCVIGCTIYIYVKKKIFCLYKFHEDWRKKFDDYKFFWICPLLLEYEYYYSVSIENTNILSSCLINKTTLDRCILLSISNFPLFDILGNETRWKRIRRRFFI